MNWRDVIDGGSKAGGLALWLVLTVFVGLGILLIGAIVFTWVGRLLS